MKVRSDFVSNSSSSSFVLVGATFDVADAIKQIADAGKLPEEILEQYKSGEIDEEEVVGELWDGIGGLEVQTEGYDYAEHICFGIDPSKMKDNETLGQFKDNVLEKLKSIGLKAKKSDVGFVTGGSDASGASWFGDCG